MIGIMKIVRVLFFCDYALDVGILQQTVYLLLNKFSYILFYYRLFL